MVARSGGCVLHAGHGIARTQGRPIGSRRDAMDHGHQSGRGEADGNENHGCPATEYRRTALISPTCTPDIKFSCAFTLIVRDGTNEQIRMTVPNFHRPKQSQLGNERMGDLEAYARSATSVVTLRETRPAQAA